MYNSASEDRSNNHPFGRGTMYPANTLCVRIFSRFLPPWLNELNSQHPHPPVHDRCDK